MEICIHGMDMNHFTVSLIMCRCFCCPQNNSWKNFRLLCRRLLPQLNWILPSFGLFCGVRWFETDVLGLPSYWTAWYLTVGAVGSSETSVLEIWRRVITQKTFIHLDVSHHAAVSFVMLVPSVLNWYLMRCSLVSKLNAWPRYEQSLISDGWIRWSTRDLAWTWPLTQYDVRLKSDI
jgi:hypothetical protein